jgi:hypothetical protein
MIIYRVQDFTGHGPWTSTVHETISPLVETYSRKWGKLSSPSELPGPWTSMPGFQQLDYLCDEVSVFRKIRAQMRDFFSEHFRFGCYDPRQLDLWFTSDFRHILQWHGYRLFIFDAEEVIVGRLQCAFLPKTAKRLAVFNLETFNASHYHKG